ncbi:hypothetical protein ACLB2K_063632 [Fragaria x ananassa]
MSRSGQPPDLKKYMDKKLQSKFAIALSIISSLFALAYTGFDLLLYKTLVMNTLKLNANRMIVGTLRGFDQFMNLVVDNTVEVNGDEKTDIGMVVIRGNSVVTVEALEPVAKMQ